MQDSVMGGASGHADELDSVSARLQSHVRAVIQQAGGWLPFDQFMALALYSPEGGYYARASQKFGWLPASGSDFVTAPELSPLFGRTLAVQVAEWLTATGTDQVYEFGPGSGALAEQVLEALLASGQPLSRYHLVDVSGHLRARQAERLARFGDRVVWLDAWPDAIEGVVLGNEVLDAMPVKLLAFDGQAWHERGVALVDGVLVFADRPTRLRPPLDAAFVPGTVTEIHGQAEAFVTSLAERLQRGAALFIDYGFPEAEYYLPARHGGTLMCHQAHRADADPLSHVGDKDITAHVNFTGVALAAQNAGLQVLGYSSQGRFLLNCGLADLMNAASLAERNAALRLVNEHEMGELFKAIALGAPGLEQVPLGFQVGDRTHRL